MELAVEVDGETTRPARVDTDQRQTVRSVHVAAVDATSTRTAYWEVHEPARHTTRFIWCIGASASHRAVGLQFGKTVVEKVTVGQEEWQSIVDFMI